jgi:hypothetical protein
MRCIISGRGIHFCKNHMCVYTIKSLQWWVTLW